jgi:hypothetical protein
MRLTAIFTVIALAGAFSALATSAASADTEDMIQVQETLYCLDGTISAISIQPCNPADLHQWWLFIPDSGNYSDFDTLQNEYNQYCLDGTLATVYPIKGCSTSDEHQEWFYFLGIFSNAEDVGYCLDGTLSKVYLTTDDGNCGIDLHTVWNLGTFST